MAYTVFKHTELQKSYSAVKGLEGPFHYANGMTLYYDPKEGKYWNPKTDMFLEYDDYIFVRGGA
jgi:hypothetical protein